MSDNLYKNKQTLDDKIKYMDQFDAMRKQSENVFLERENLEKYHKQYEFQTMEQPREEEEKGKQVVKSSSLSSMKTGEERIQKKDKDQYVNSQKEKREELKEELSEKGIYATDEQKTLLIEYRQLGENARLFDNEVRETVDSVLRKRPNFLGDLPQEEKVEKLSKLLTAFLPQREFHFNPPSKRQREAVDDFLSDFKKNPVKSILKMQTEQENSRTHRDLRDAANGAASFRMLYCEMRKRETLADIFPHIANGQEDYAEKARQVGEFKNTVPMYKQMLESLLKVNGINAGIPEDLEFNREYKNTKTDVNGKKLTKKQKEDARKANMNTGFNLFEKVRVNRNIGNDAPLETYLLAVERIRTAERRYNRKRKTALNTRLIEKVGVYKNDKFYDESIADKLSYVETQPLVYAGETQLAAVPMETTGLKIKVKSEKAIAEERIHSKLKGALRDLNYTRYRVDALSKVKVGGNVTKEYLNTNKEKEKLRLSYLQKRSDELFNFLQALREDVGFLDKLKDGKINELTEEEKRFKVLYENELSEDISKTRTDLVLDSYRAYAMAKIKEFEDDYLPDPPEPVYNEKGEIDLTNPNNFAIPVQSRNACKQIVKETREYRVWLKKYDAYADLKKQKLGDPEVEEKINKKKNLFYNHVGLPEKHLDVAKEQRKLIREAQNAKNITALVNKDEVNLYKKVSGGCQERWNALDQKGKEEVFKNLFGIQGEVTGEKIDTPFLDDLYKQQMLYYLDPRGFEEWAKFYPDQVVLKEEDRDAKKIRESVDSILKSHSEDFETEYNSIQFGAQKGYDIAFYGNVRKDLDRMRGKYYNVMGSGEYKYADRASFSMGEGKWGKWKEVYLTKMREEIKEGRKKKKEREEFEERMRIKAPEHLETLEKLKEDLSRVIKGGEFVPNPQNVEELSSQYEQIKNYFEWEEKYMVPETLEKFKALREELKDAYYNARDTYEKNTDAEYKSIKERIDNLDKEFDEAPEKLTEESLDKVVKQIKKLSFGMFVPKDLTAALEEREATYPKLLERIEKYKEAIVEERETGRAEVMRNIRSQLSGLTVPATPEELKLMTDEDLKLRKVSSLSMLCHAYLQNFKEKAVFSGQKRDYEAVEQILKDLGTEYMPQLLDKVSNDEFNDADEDLINIGREAMRWTGLSGDGFERRRNLLNITDKLENVKPVYRYYLKYAKAYQVLSSYQEIGFFKAKFTNTVKEQQKKDNLARQRANYLENNIFYGMYTGLETEEEEAEFTREAYKHYMKLHAGDEEKEEKEYREAVKKQETYKNNQAVKQLLSENEEITPDLEMIHKMAEQIRRFKEQSPDLRLREDLLEDALNRVDAVQQVIWAYTNVSVSESELDLPEILALREDAKVIEEEERIQTEQKNKDHVENVRKDLNKLFRTPEAIHEVLNKKALGDNFKRADYELNVVYRRLKTLGTSNPGYKSDEKVKTQYELSMIAIQYNNTILQSRRLSKMKEEANEEMKKLTKTVSEAKDIKDIDFSEIKRVTDMNGSIGKTAREWLAEVQRTGFLTEDMEMFNEKDDPKLYVSCREKLRDLSREDVNPEITDEFRKVLADKVITLSDKIIADTDEIIKGYENLKSPEEKKEALDKLKEGVQRYNTSRATYSEITHSILPEEDGILLNQKVIEFATEENEKLNIEALSFAPVQAVLQPISVQYDELRKKMFDPDFNYLSKRSKGMIESLKTGYAAIREQAEFKKYYESDKASAVRKEQMDKLGRDIDQLVKEFYRWYDFKVLEDFNGKLSDVREKSSELITKKGELTKEELKTIDEIKANIDKLISTPEIKALLDKGMENAGIAKDMAEGLKINLTERAKAEKNRVIFKESSSKWLVKATELDEKYHILPKQITEAHIKEVDDIVAESTKLKESEEYKALIRYGIKDVGIILNASEKQLKATGNAMKDRYLRAKLLEIKTEAGNIGFFSSKKKKTAQALKAIAALRESTYYRDLEDGGDNSLALQLENQIIRPYEEELRSNK